MVGNWTRWVLRLWVVGVLLFLALPILTIIIFAFDSSTVQSWPLAGFTFHWFSVAFNDPQVRAALILSIKAGVAATILSMVLGSMAAFGVHRFRFFGRESISLLLVVPLALPGIITGLALQSAFTFAGVELSLITIIIGHTTFCIVVVYNNALARLRRVSGSIHEASMDLGADGWQTFRFVTVPTMSTAFISAALLAFALSFDEVIVTVFTAGAQNTLPLWIFGAIRLGQQLPEVNAVVVFVLLFTIIPVTVAARLTGGGGLARSTLRAGEAPAPPGSQAAEAQAEAERVPVGAEMPGL